MPVSERVTGRRPIQILVVDDEPGIVDLLREFLESANYRVDTASDGRMALEKVTTGAYDAIICDLRMPVLDGLEFYQELEHRESALARRLIFIVGDPGLAQGGVPQAVDVPTLVKPFSPEELLQAVRRVTGASG